jgi:hypothetical protein
MDTGCGQSSGSGGKEGRTRCGTKVNSIAGKDTDANNCVALKTCKKAKVQVTSAKEDGQKSPTVQASE